MLKKDKLLRLYDCGDCLKGLSVVGRKKEAELDEVLKENDIIPKYSRGGEEPLAKFIPIEENKDVYLLRIQGIDYSTNQVKVLIDGLFDQADYYIQAPISVNTARLIVGLTPIFGDDLNEYNYHLREYNIATIIHYITRVKTQTALASELNITQKHISRMYCGYARPNVDILEKFAQAYPCFSYESLFYRRNSI